ncbi:MAG: aldo/keto reductase [Planctomycetes bacterium]|nr:aldo/keto reductase [Planctomycetota bacterium]
MQYTTLGRTAVKVSRLCLGTMNFGPFTGEDDSRAIMDRALETGITFFDTADAYGHRGGTEEIIGRWLAQGGRRDRIVLATKVYSPMGEGPNDRGLSAWHIRQACEASLRRLQTDHIDLYQMHHVDRTAPWEEVWQAMEQLVQQGKILYVGSSNFAGWHIARANEQAARRHFMGLVSEQCKYSLVTRAVETDVLPAARAYGLGIIPWSPLAQGILAGALEKARQGTRRAREGVVKQVEKLRAQLEEYETLCRDLGEHPAIVALAWLLSNPVVTAPIIGPRTLDQLDSSLRAVDLALGPDTLGRLDAIWPGPGGESPEFFAW